MVLVAVVLVAPTLFLSLHLAEKRGLNETAYLKDHALTVARAAAAQYGNMIALARAQLESVAPSIASSLDPSDCQQKLAQYVIAQSIFFQLYVADHFGEMVCTGRPLARKVNIADRPYLVQAFESRRFLISELLKSRASDRWTIVAAEPLADGRSRVLFGALDLAWLQATLDNFSLPAGSIISLVDGDSRVVARIPFVPEFIGRQVGGGADGRRPGPEAEVIEERPNLAGVPSIIASVPVPGTNMSVHVGLPQATAEAVYRHTIYEAGAAIVATLLLAGLTGFLAFRGLIVGPIGALTRAAARLGAGDLTARTGIAYEESVVGRLAQKLDELATHGARVTRALRALSAGNRTLLRERDEMLLLHAMCKVAVDKGGYAVAYVCYAREDEAKSIDVMAQYGEDHGFISAARLTWADTESGQGTVGRCIRLGERALIRSIAQDPGTGPWRQAAKASGFAAVISLPLRVSGTLIGTFTLMAREDGFDDAEIELLDEMAADLSFGIEVIRAEARRKEAEAIARRALTHDALIDIPNRVWFVRRVVECIQRGARNHEPVAVLDVHVGHLQEITDSFGHERGMEVLRQVAERLKQLPGAEDNLGRLPMDDFGIVLCAYDADAAARAARAVLEVFSTPIRLGEALIDVKASVGISMFPGHGDEAEILIRRASIAARDALKGDQPHAVYSGAMARENPARLSLAAELRGAIETRQLELHFQPKLNVADGSVSGCEALVRWPHPTRGMIPPLQFIDLAEEIGLIRPMTYKIIDMAVRQIHAWQAAGLRTPVAVNLSARNLYDPELLNTMEGLFSTWGVPRELVHFEITEGALVDDPRAARKTLERLSEHGAKIYIDDFGTGYSSLSYLVSLPVHALKIDRSFVTQMTKSAQARDLVASIISMAHRLHLRVVAEGVETAEDVAGLRELGCDEAQGFHYSRPMPASQYETWLRNRPGQNTSTR
jgi:diguanylate cyclase (GGDEF)-like protein